MAEETNPELATFRKEWQDEVTARAKASTSRTKSPGPRPSSKQGRETKGLVQTLSPVTHLRSDKEDDESHDEIYNGTYHDLENKNERRRLGEDGLGTHLDNVAIRAPGSALEHYEQAVERESQGNLGESVKLYRKAYRVGAF